MSFVLKTPTMKIFIGAHVKFLFATTDPEKVLPKLIDEDKRNNTALHDTYATESKSSIFGDYQAVDYARVASAPPVEQQTIQTIRESAKKDALRTVAIFPVIMLVTYLVLILYFRSKGGYKAVFLTGEKTL